MNDYANPTVLTNNARVICIVEVRNLPRASCLDVDSLNGAVVRGEDCRRIWLKASFSRGLMLGDDNVLRHAVLRGCLCSLGDACCERLVRVYITRRIFLP